MAQLNSVGNGGVAGGTDLGGAIGNILYKPPGYNSTPLDAGTNSIIDQQVKRAGMSDEDVAKEHLQGINEKFSDGSGQFSSALGGYQDPAMGAALQARASRLFDSDLNHIQRQAKINAPAQRAGQMGQAMGSLEAAQQANNANNLAELQARQNRQATRSAVIAGIFSQAGSAAAFKGGGAGGGGAPSSSGGTFEFGSKGGSPTAYNSKNFGRIT